jgi:hypothetical protein
VFSRGSSPCLHEFGTLCIAFTCLISVLHELRVACNNSCETYVLLCDVFEN